MAYRAIRFVLYPLLFAFATILVGLTSYRIHYTETLSHGDILTTDTHFYDPKIVALLVVSILILIFSAAMLVGVAVCGNAIAIPEQIGLWGLWIFLLVTAALVTHKWHNLRWCRTHFRECRILETIKAFSWILWGFLTIMIIVALVDLFTTGSDRETTRGTRGAVTGAAYADTREHRPPGTQTATQPVHSGHTSGVQTNQGASPTHGASTKHSAYVNQQQQQQPFESSTAPALYSPVAGVVPTNQTVQTDRMV